MNVRLLVDVKRGVTLVPTAAVQRGPQSMFVYVMKADDTVAMRVVTLGPAEADTTAILDGLAPGEGGRDGRHRQAHEWLEGRGAPARWHRRWRGYRQWRGAGGAAAGAADGAPADAGAPGEHSEHAGSKPATHQSASPAAKAAAPGG